MDLSLRGFGDEISDGGRGRRAHSSRGRAWTSVDMGLWRGWTGVVEFCLLDFMVSTNYPSAAVRFMMLASL